MERLEARALLEKAWGLLQQESTDAALRTLQELPLEGLDLRDEVERVILKAQLDYRLNSLQNAEASAMEALVLARKLGEPMQIARSQTILGDATVRQGQVDRGLRELESARCLAIPKHRWSRISFKLANYTMQSGQIARSLSLLDEIQAQAGKLPGIATTRLANAVIVGDPSQITRHIRRVQKVADPPQALPRFACLLARGVAHLHSGRPDLAAKQFRKARYFNDETLKNTDCEGEARLRQAEALIASGSHRFKALEQIAELTNRLDDFQNPLLQAEIHRVHAKGLRLCDEADASDSAYEACYALTQQSDRALYRYFALREHSEALLEEVGLRSGADTLLRRVLADARGCVRLFDHPVFEWNLRVLEVLSSSRLAPDPEIAELDECRDALRAAHERGEISDYHRDTWIERLETELAKAREQLQESLAKDVDAMEEVVAGLRSEDTRAHLRAFTRSVGDRLGADRVLMVIESDAQGTLDVIAAHGLNDDQAVGIARALMPMLGPDEPAMIRELSSSTDPVATALRQALALPESPGSLDAAITATNSRSAMAFAIDGAGVVVGLIYVDRPIASQVPPFRTADLRDFAFLSNGLAAVSRLASARAHRETRIMKDRLEGVTRRHGILTRSNVLLRVLERVERVAATEVPLLVLGESGTGKELIARAVHASSSRPDGPFVPVNCAAIPATLIEAEFFGYQRGAFTGAEREKVGYFLAADRGTIFLDEIGELPAEMQAKFLRVLEDGRVTPLGRTKAVETSFRVVAATNANIERSVETGSFRSDLYFRLRGFSVQLPPLRDRPEDIRLLADHFLTLQAIALGFKENSFHFTAEAYRALERHDWPGNVRELRQVVQSAAVLRDLESNEVGLDALMEHVVLELGDSATVDRLDPGLLGRISTVADEIGTPSLVATIERYLTDRALEKSGGNQRAAARALAMGESTLRRRLRTIARKDGD